MFLVIIGGSASGKSEYAEARAMAMRAERRAAAGGKMPGLLYLAAMMPLGEDAAKRIKRHRQLRAGKGFETIERYCDLEGLCRGESAEAERFRRKAEGAVVLLECMSNLTANEIFAQESAPGDGSGEAGRYRAAETRILNGIRALRELASDLILVTIDVFGDGRCYDAETEGYRQTLGCLNQQLADRADEVTEVVYTLPVIHKRAAKTDGEDRCGCSH